MSSNRPNKDLNTYKFNQNDAGMFSSSQIAYYIETFRIIENHDESCYDSASYHMRIGGPILTWDGSNKTEFLLAKEDDSNKNKFKSVELQPNSLTFVTTIEKFNLPKDIICRFNLKSKWVHQGLLLGTGPIVDPQLHARLLIPLHNFSSHPIRMNYGDKIISVEFTKTLNPDEFYSLPDGTQTKFIENTNWNFDFYGYRNRIENKVVESSVLNKFRSLNDQFESYKKSTDEIIKSNEKTIGAIEKENEKSREASRKLNIIGFVGVVISLVVLVITTWQLIESTHEKIDAAYNLIKQYDDKSVDFRSFALQTNVKSLRDEFENLKAYYERLNSRAFIKSNEATAELVQMKKEFDARLKAIEKKIEASNMK